MFSVSADEKSFLRAREQLELLSLKPQARVRILKAIGKVLIRQTKQNIRAQRDPDGTPWPKRKKGRKKMLRGFTRKLTSRVRDNKRVLQTGWFSKRGVVALSHHKGKTARSGRTARGKQATRNKEPKSTDPATRDLAKELRDLGYRLKPQGRQKKGRKPTIKWITQNLTIGEANKIIYELDNRTPARTWGIERPERRLIGMSAKRVAIIIKRELKRNRS